MLIAGVAEWPNAQGREPCPLVGTRVRITSPALKSIRFNNKKVKVNIIENETNRADKPLA